MVTIVKVKAQTASTPREEENAAASVQCAPQGSLIPAAHPPRIVVANRSARPLQFGFFRITLRSIAHVINA
jgi:hypothetical protein